MRALDTSENKAVNVSETVEESQSTIDLPTRTDHSFTLDLSPTSTPLNVVEAAQSKIAGRRSASSVSDQEYKDFLEERQQLLDRKFAGEITRTENNRLEYVRWSLDRIEDARHGVALDVLEDQVEQYENLVRQIEILRQQLEVHATRRRR